MLLIMSLIVFSGCYHWDSLHLYHHKLRTQILDYISILG